MIRVVLIVLYLAVGSLYPIGAYASDGKTRDHSEKLMGEFTADTFNEEFRFLEKYLSPKLAEDLRTQLKGVWNDSDQVRAVEYELISKEKLGKSFVQYYYLLKFDTGALYVLLRYYNVRDNWIIQKVKYGDDYEFLFEKTK